VAAHTRLMPVETQVHPAARAVGGARSRVRPPAPDAQGAGVPGESGVAGELLGVSSLARAVAGEANVGDVGALTWMMLKPMLPCTAMGLFVHDEERDVVVNCFATGTHAGMLRGLTATPGEGIVGWVAAHRRPAVNAETALDFGVRANELDPPLLSTLAVPLIHDGALVAVLAVYGSTRGAFSDDHARLLDLLAPRLAAAFTFVRASDGSESPSRSAPRRQAGGELRLLRGRRV
jgi:GAF domain-containing protein